MEEVKWWFIRWSHYIEWPSGNLANMYCYKGTYSEAKEFAESKAKEYGYTVEAII